MSHSFDVTDPNAEELAAIERARRYFRALGHTWEEPLVLWYSGDGRVWAGYRSVGTTCLACQRLVDYGEHDANVPETGLYHAVDPKWVTSQGGGVCHTAEGCYRLDEPCPGKPTFCDHDGDCPWDLL